MSYLTQQPSKNRTTSIVVVVLLHALLAWALVSGLAVDVAKKVIENIETVNIKEEAPPPEEPPPPPPKLEEIPPFVPPPIVQVETSSPPPPTINVQTAVPTPTPPPAPVPQAPAPAPAPAPAVPGTPAVRGNARAFETTEDDYPDASRRAEEQGVTTVRVTIGADGRVSACSVATSSGFSRLDERTCQIAQRRWRYKPATENGQPVQSEKLERIRWQLREGR